MKTKIANVAKKVFEKASEQEFKGYDPFDGLNSQVFNAFPSFKNSLIGLAWTQVFKRSPINFRPFSGVPRARNPKGIGLFILGLVLDYRLSGNTEYLNKAIDLAEWLDTQKCDLDTWQYACWGYHFDWKARAFFVPKGKPNVITTIYVAQALYELSQVIDTIDRSKSERYRKLAIDSANFIVNHLFTEQDKVMFFAYIPGESAFVHNASLWAAGWVAFIGAETKNEEFQELAFTVARQSVKAQNSDGSWPYGTRSHHQFIDGFHTGYNLEALDLIRKSLGTDEFDSAIEKGFAFYKANLFEADGTAKYYHNNQYPWDPHSVSQAIITLLKLGDGNQDVVFTEKVIGWAIDNLYMPEKGQFVYQKNAGSVNKINYMRWTQAWMYYSLSFYLSYKEGSDEKN